MKFVIALLGISAITLAQPQTAPSTTPSAAPAGGAPTGPFIRNLPADQLRDFAGLCFASTLCRVFQPGESWPLTPFCGQAQCVQSPQGFLIERVEDCGPLPKPNPKCKIVNEAARNETFPLCCPKFECDAGHKLEFPTAEELHNEALKLAQAQQPGSTAPQA